MKKNSLRRPLSPTERVAKRKFKPSNEPKATSEQVDLVEGNARNSGHKGSRYVKYWHIFFDKQRVGRVYITKNVNDGKDYFAITVEINQKFRGRGIGTIVFRQAAEQSGVTEIVAEVRRSNIASIIAVSRANYKEEPDTPGKPLRFVWRDTADN